MKRFIISIPIVIAVVLLVTFLQDKTYSKYKKRINVNITDTTGNLICDAELDNPGTYVSEDGWAYFIVIVKNYDNKTLHADVTDVPFEYNLEVTNADGSSALYRYSTGSDVGIFASTSTTANYQFTETSRQTKEFVFEVKTTNQNAEDVDFVINLNCYQIAK